MIHWPLPNTCRDQTFPRKKSVSLQLLLLKKIVVHIRTICTLRNRAYLLFFLDRFSFPFSCVVLCKIAAEHTSERRWAKEQNEKQIMGVGGDRCCRCRLVILGGKQSSMSTFVARAIQHLIRRTFRGGNHLRTLGWASVEYLSKCRKE
jgi:hypothetical protein